MHSLSHTLSLSLNSLSTSLVSHSLPSLSVSLESLSFTHWLSPSLHFHLHTHCSL